MKNQKTITIIREMCMLFSVSRADENRTIRFFERLPRAEYLADVKPVHLRALYEQLRAESCGTDETVKRKFKYVRRVFTYAHNCGYIKTNPCSLMKLPKGKRAQIITLTPEHVAQIENYAPATLGMQRVKDYFLFQVYTGLAYTDFKNFGKEKIVETEGMQYINGTRAKTGTEYIIPFGGKAKQLAERYNYHFGVSCNQLYNRDLKTLQRLAEVQTKLTTHLARRTFGQIKLDEGVRLEIVSRMLGHASPVITERFYARVNLTTINNEMRRAA